MTTIYTPWHVQPRQLPSNLIPLRPSTQTESTGERTLLPALPVASKFPSVIVTEDAFHFPKQRTVTTCIIRMRVNSQHIRVRTLSHTSPLPATGNWPRDLKRSFSLVSGPLSRRNLGTIAADLQFFGAVLRALRSLSSPCVQACKQALGGLPYGFNFLRWLVALVHDENSNRGAGACPAINFPRTEKEFPRSK